MTTVLGTGFTTTRFRTGGTTPQSFAQIPIKQDEGARDLYMTIEQQMLEVREEMQQYIVSANKRADEAEQEAANAKQKAINAEQKAADAEQKAADAEMKAANAEHQNIANIIGICRNFNYSDELIIEQLMRRVPLTYDEAAKALTEY